MNPTVYEPDTVHDGSGRAVPFGGSRLSIGFTVETQVYCLLVHCIRECRRCVSEIVLFAYC